MFRLCIYFKVVKFINNRKDKIYMERVPVEEYLMEKYGRDISLSISLFLQSVDGNWNVVGERLWNRANAHRKGKVDGLLYIGIISICEEGRIDYKDRSWLEGLDGLVEIVKEFGKE